MSTNARIGVVRPAPDRENYQIESIYVHWDGYPSYVGKKLLDHWTDRDKIEELIQLGDISTLSSEIGEKHDFDTHNGTFDFEAKTRTPSEAQEKGWCLFYGRDREESDVASKTHAAEAWPDYGQEYEYLFDGESWAFRDTYGSSNKDFEPLTPEAIARDEGNA